MELLQYLKLDEELKELRLKMERGIQYTISTI